jgi:fluoride ion exporter CrcB/FEX
MPAFHTGPVREVLSERPGLQKVAVDLSESGRGEHERAYVLVSLTGPVAVGDEVVVNTTAVDLDLGTGGWHFVHWNLSRRSWSEPGPGHIIKLRYTSLQADTGSAEEHDGDVPTTLDGIPVVACGLHSQMASAALAFHHHAPDKRLVYVMTDGAALPIVFSDLVYGLREQGVLTGTVTVGNAFGGDLEAVSVPSGLTLARHRLDADAVIIGMGPGVTGTATTFGTTAVEVASLLDYASALDGLPIMCLRVSNGDPRPRHRGISHHSLTALSLCRSSVTVALADPADPAGPTEDPAILERHVVAMVEPPAMAPLIAASGLAVTTMGRGPSEDEAFFRAAGAAGTLAATWVAG